MNEQRKCVPLEAKMSKIHFIDTVHFQLSCKSVFNQYSAASNVLTLHF